MQLIISGASYDAGLSHVEPTAEKRKGYGRQVTLLAVDKAQWEQWMECLNEAALEAAEDGNKSLMETLYRDIERADIAAGKPVLI